jgi:hypothetical protein
MLIRKALQASLTGALLMGSFAAHAVFIGNIQGGADFPQGAVSFADQAISYSPGLVGVNPTTPHRGDFNALDVPDYAGVKAAPRKRPAPSYRLATAAASRCASSIIC